MHHRILALAFATLLLAPTAAHAALNEFSVADGYMSPFFTRVWTYNALWSFDSGALNNNYVAQHGYNAGFATSEPFALVVRNDNAPGSYQFSYNFVSSDLAGLNPASIPGAKLTIGFDVCSTVSQNSSTANGAPMLTMKFGGTAPSPGLTLAFSDSNYLMWSNGAGVLSEFTGYQLNSGSWDRISLVMDFATDTYDLTVSPMTGNGINGSNTYTPTNTFNVVTGMSFTNPLSSMPKLFFETFTDPEDGGGWHKMFIDHFTSSQVPEPSTAALAAVMASVFALRRPSRA